MKKYLFIALSFAAFKTYAQDCAGYYYMQGNKTIEMTMYKNNGDEHGKRITKISGVATSGSTMTSVATTEVLDKKGKTVSTGTNKMECTGGVFKCDIKVNIPESQQKQIDRTDGAAKADNVYVEYPASMKVGDVLKDAVMHMDMTTNTNNGSRGIDETVDMSITNRKVVAKESVTSPAGTWECFKITATSRIQIKMAGIGFPMTFDITEWFVPGFGIVKTESKYGTTLITSIK
jgi:hypothetical protein